MISAPIPGNEKERLAALLHYEVLDSDAELAFDELTQLASTICDAPISLISLIDESRQWFKSKVGLDADETPRSAAFCAHAILGDELLEVPNALDDPRFADNPLVIGDPDIRFYAGAPLITSDNFRLGTLCVIDRTPRKLTEEQKNALSILSRQAISQLELRLRARQQERINNAREKIFQVIAHDLRNPFNSILNFSKKLSQHPDSLKPEQIAGISRSLLSASINAYQVLDELLQWYQQRLGSHISSPESLALHTLAESSVGLLQDIATAKLLTIKINLDKNIFVSADAALTKTVIRNLLANAIKYSPDRGEILLQALATDDEVHISIQDNGCGIPIERQSFLFVSPLESEAGTHGEKGLGIGLSLCKEFMAMQSGKIWLDTQFTEGTRIVFSLPLVNQN